MTEAKKVYGLLDTVDNLWLDTNEQGTGPRTFENQIMARIVAEILTDQLGWPSGRIKVEEYVEDNPRLKDELQKEWHGNDNVLNWLRKKESGVIP